MTAIGKISTVVLAIASVLFMTAALAVVTTGPNWQAKADQVEGYVFSKSGGENPQWTATDVSTGDPVKSAPNLADVIPAAADARVKKIQDEINQLRERSTQLEEAMKVAVSTRDQDQKLLEARIQRLSDRINAAREQTTQTAGQLAAVNDQIRQFEEQIAARRGDVFRLRAVLDQAELDAVRAERLRGQLADLLVQLDADLQAARARRTQLKQEMGESDGGAGSASLTGNPTATKTAPEEIAGVKTQGDAL